MASQTRLDTVLLGERAAVDADAFRTVTVRARLCGHYRRCEWGVRIVLVEIDTRQSIRRIICVYTLIDTEQIAIIARHEVAADDPEGVASATNFNQFRQVGNDTGPGRPLGTIAALKVVVA